uniref:C-type lectin domain-containing protein n=1 Tax=Sciurus vulgaris TaxID=55149 RepID=A0A8D2AH06_SCIVU
MIWGSTYIFYVYFICFLDFLTLHLYDLLPDKGKVWSCYLKDWKSFSSSCYFIFTDAKSWNESQENCSRMEAHLVVITQQGRDFIILNLQTGAVYYVGLSDPEGQRLWQWVDGTPYNPSATFWHLGEPSHSQEQCVTLTFRPSTRWGWNDVGCHHDSRSVCEMMTIYL